MKTNLKFFTTLLISVYLLSAVSFAQTQYKEVIFTVSKKGDNFFSKNSLGQKTIDFTISGISTQEDMDAFSVKFKTIDGVINLEVVAGVTSGTWTATATFFERINKKLLQNILLQAGVKKVIIDGKAYSSEEIGTFSTK